MSDPDITPEDVVPEAPPEVPVAAPSRRSRKKAAAEEAEDPAVVFYVSAYDPEPSAFEVAKLKPFRQFSSGKLVWAVPADDAERFERHHHFVTGRVVRAPDTFTPEQF